MDKTAYDDLLKNGSPPARPGRRAGTPCLNTALPTLAENAEIPRPPLPAAPASALGMPPATGWEHAQPCVIGVAIASGIDRRHRAGSIARQPDGPLPAL